MRDCGDLELVNIYLMIDESIRARLSGNCPLCAWRYL